MKISYESCGETVCLDDETTQDIERISSSLSDAELFDELDDVIETFASSYADRGRHIDSVSIRTSIAAMLKIREVLSNAQG